MIKKSPYQLFKRGLKIIYKNNNWSMKCHESLYLYEPPENGDDAFELAERVCDETKDKNDNPIFPEKAKLPLFRCIVYWLTQKYTNMYRIGKDDLKRLQNEINALESVYKYAEKTLSPYTFISDIPQKLKEAMDFDLQWRKTSIIKNQKSLKPFKGKRRTDIIDTFEPYILKYICDIIQKKRGNANKPGHYSRGVIKLASEAWRPIVKTLRRNDNPFQYTWDKLNIIKQFMPLKIMPLYGVGIKSFSRPVNFGITIELVPRDGLFPEIYLKK